MGERRVTDDELRKVIGGAYAFVEPPSAGHTLWNVCLDALDHRAEIARLECWVADLQAGTWVNCVYCGHRYGPGETTPVSMADALKAHIEACPKHPMSALKADRDSLRREVDAEYAKGLQFVTDIGFLKAENDSLRREVEDCRGALNIATVTQSQLEREMSTLRRVSDCLIKRIVELNGDCSRCGDHFHVLEECPL